VPAMDMTPLMGDPLRWPWLGFFGVVLVVHLRHVRRMHGAHRLWHGGHALMAAAMAGMLLPAELGTVSAPLWFVGTAGATGAAVVYALLHHWDGAPIDVPWITLVVGLAATAYMWLMMVGVAAAPLTYAAAAWLVCEALGWFTGLLSGRRRNSPLSPAGPADPDPRPAAARPATVARTLYPANVGTASPRPFLAGEKPLAFAATRADRLALGLSALGMAYLFMAMQQMPMHH
jgi:hypothetical protein